MPSIEVTPHRAGARWAQRAGGFTLVEILVALAMTGMLVALLMSSLYYGTRVQAGLADELQVRERSLRRVDWFASSLQGCMPLAPATGAAMAATGTEITCMTVSPLQARAHPSPQRIRWALRKSANDPRIAELTYKDLDDSQSREFLVESFQASQARFAYVGVNGQEVLTWPLNAQSPETLPRLIYMVLGDGRTTQVAWVTALLADPWLEQEVKNPFGMEPTR